MFRLSIYFTLLVTNTVLVQKNKIIITILLFIPLLLCGQSSTELVDTLKHDKTFIAGYPIVFYFPATKFGFGGAGILTFQLNAKDKKEQYRLSQTQVALVYTLNKQLLALVSWKLFFGSDTYQSNGEIGYYDYFYNFYGIGPDTQFEDEEQYFVRFPRLKVNMLKNIGRYGYIGPKIEIDGYNITEIDSSGIIYNQNLTGIDGGITAELGFVAQYDHRDNIFYPTDGYFLELEYSSGTQYLGSDYSFDKIRLKANKYLNFKENHIIAFDARVAWASTGTPFYESNQYGGPTLGRGYAVGRFQDYNLMIVQGEYRFPIYRRIGAVVYGSVGNVFAEYAESMEALKWNYGTGLRFNINKKDHINLRLDVAFGAEEPQFYFTIGEAF